MTKQTDKIKTCKDCIYEDECCLDTDACERFKSKELFESVERESI